LLTVRGELHGTAAARSREHVVLVIVPDVAHANVAVDEEVVRPPGADVKEMRGAVDVGGGGGGGAEVTLHE
jgi:hypothetical protein